MPVPQFRARESSLLLEWRHNFEQTGEQRMLRVLRRLLDLGNFAMAVARCVCRLTLRVHVGVYAAACVFRLVLRRLLDLGNWKISGSSSTRNNLNV